MEFKEVSGLFGNQRLMNKNKVKLSELSISRIQDLEEQGKTVMILSDNKKVSKFDK